MFVRVSEQPSILLDVALYRNGCTAAYSRCWFPTSLENQYTGGCKQLAPGQMPKEHVTAHGPLVNFWKD